MWYVVEWLETLYKGEAKMKKPQKPVRFGGFVQSICKDLFLLHFQNQTSSANFGHFIFKFLQTPSSASFLFCP